MMLKHLAAAALLIFAWAHETSEAASYRPAADQAEFRFPMPEFESGYKHPEMNTPLPVRIPAAVDITVLSDDTGDVLSRAGARLVASAGGLVAMKATTVTLRASSKPEKRASDLFDLGRLVAHTDGPRELDAAPLLLRAAVLSRLRGWFVDPKGRDRTFRDVRRFDEAPLDLDEVAEIVDELDGR